MTTGDEPRLGGQTDDNSPMISGRGTKIIADARGAYITGNLQGLADHMTDEQRLVFQQTLVRMALDAHRADLIYAGQNGEPEILEFVREMDAWLEHPTEENVQRLNERKASNGDLFDQGTVPRTYALHPFSYRLNTFWDLKGSYRDVLRLSFKISALFPTGDQRGNKPHEAVLYDELEHWYLDVAWALLRGRPIPHLDIDPQTIDSLLTDAEHWYRRKHLELLVHQMNSAQDMEFKRAVLQQALHLIDTIPGDSYSSDDLKRIDSARRWFAQPELVAREFPAADRAADGERKIIGTSPTLSATHSLLRAFVIEPNHDFELKLPYVERVSELARHLFSMRDGVSYYATDDIRDRVRHWQIEAAWAILHDQPIPSLEEL
jgi:hypothetical protein